MKYEYMLHTWGGFYNEEHKHGYVKGYFWFDTDKAREKYLSELKEVEKRLNARVLAFSKEEGIFTRQNTVAKMVFVYRGKEYPYECDFGFAYPPEAAEYMFTEGNYSCDCNRSRFIGGDFPELGCGEQIKMKDFMVQEQTDAHPES